MMETAFINAEVINKKLAASLLKNVFVEDLDTIIAKYAVLKDNVEDYIETEKRNLDVLIAKEASSNQYLTNTEINNRNLQRELKINQKAYQKLEDVQGGLLAQAKILLKDEQEKADLAKQSYQTALAASALAKTKAPQEATQGGIGEDQSVIDDEKHRKEVLQMEKAFYEQKTRSE